MLPILCFMNICAFLDKANIGNANTAGMSKDLGFSTSQYKCVRACSTVVQRDLAVRLTKTVLFLRSSMSFTPRFSGRWSC
jgi:hypothetical protein